MRNVKLSNMEIKKTKNIKTKNLDKEKPDFNQSLVNNIRTYFGLNIYETKVWLALLSKGLATIGEMHDLSNVPRSRIYDVLESLEKEGFVVSKLGKPMKYMAVKPERVIERLKVKAKREADEKSQILSRVKDTQEYKQLLLLHKHGIQPIQVENIATSMTGRPNIYSQLREMFSQAQKEVVLVTNVNALRKKIRYIKPIIPKLKKQGVKVLIAANGEPNKADSVKLSELLNVKVRKIDLDARFCIVDNKEVLLITNPHGEGEDKAIHLKSDFFATAMNGLFKNSLK